MNLKEVVITMVRLMIVLTSWGCSVGAASRMKAWPGAHGQLIGRSGHRLCDRDWQYRQAMLVEVESTEEMAEKGFSKTIAKSLGLDPIRKGISVYLISENATGAR